MKRVIIIVLLIITNTISFAKPPAFNLTLIKQELIQYHDSGTYTADVNAVTQKATQYLQHRVAANQKLTHPKKLAIVFDIDETSLSSYNDMYSHNFGNSNQEVLNHIQQANMPVMPGTLALYRTAIKDHVAVFFVTGRPAYLYNSTVKNLHRVGYKQWQGLFLESKVDKKRYHSAIPFKSAARRKITQEGYDIIVNIGDQYSDLKGGFSDKTFKLPNPYYYVS